MWGRFEGKKGIRIALLSAILFLLLPVNLSSEPLPAWLIALIEDLGENSDGGAVEQLYDYYNYLLENPVDINNCSRETLESLLFLDEFMIEALLEYRSDFGSISSVAELSLIDGFSETSAERISCFFNFSREHLRQRPYSAVRGRWDSRIKYQLMREEKLSLEDAIPFSSLGKFQSEVGENCSLWFTLESDAGEVVFPDFVSFGVAVDNVPLSGSAFKIKRIVAGDYSLRMGQGGLLWNSFSLSTGSQPSSLLKRTPNAVLPYRSSGESDFYRGGAVVLSIGRWGEGTLFYSSNYVDARVEGNYFYSLPSDGIHDTESSILNKRSLRVEHTGFDYGLTFNRLKIGFRGVWYRNGKEDGRKVYEYNKYQRFSGWWYAFSADFLYSISGIRIFGEAVVDRKGASGAILGVTGIVAQGWEGALLLKYFDKKLIVPVKLNNECGGTFSLKSTAVRNLTMSASFSYTYHPHSRYRVNGSSHRYKGEVNVVWAISDRHNFSFRAKGGDDSGTGKSSLHSMAVYDYLPNSKYSLRGRFDVSYSGGYGFLGYLEGKGKFVDNQLEVSVRTTCFNIDSWDARIYCYESDVPGTFSTVAYYGSGFSGYFLLKYRPKKWVNVNLRYGGVLDKDPSKDMMRLTLGVSLIF